MSCATFGTNPEPPKPGPDAVCREPNEPEIRALTLLAHLTLPHDPSGRSIDITPGEPLPEGARGAELPELYPAAAWVAGIICRCYPERCERAKVEEKPAPRAPEETQTISVPSDDPDPVSSAERGRAPGAEVKK